MSTDYLRRICFVNGSRGTKFTEWPRWHKSSVSWWRSPDPSITESAGGITVKGKSKPSRVPVSCRFLFGLVLQLIGGGQVGLVWGDGKLVRVGSVIEIRETMNQTQETYLLHWSFLVGERKRPKLKFSLNTMGWRHKHTKIEPQTIRIFGTLYHVATFSF